VRSVHRALYTTVLLAVLLSACALKGPMPHSERVLPSHDSETVIASTTQASATVWTTSTVAATPTPSLTETPLPTATIVAPSRTPRPTPTATPPPQIVAVHPLDGDTDVPELAPLVLVFDRDIDPSVLASALTISPCVAGEISFPDSKRVTFQPSEPWPENVQVYLGWETDDADHGADNADALFCFGRGGRGAPVPVLMYHRLRNLPEDASEGARTWTVSPHAFCQQMRHLHAHGWRTVTPNQLVAYLVEGEPLPPRAFVLTMDDGYREAYEVALPLLVELGLHPTVFCVTSYVGYGAYLTWDQLRALVDADWTIGCHSYDHVALRGLVPAELDRQVRDAGSELSAELGVMVDAYCYPYGSLDEAAVAALQQAGYRSEFTLNPLSHQPRGDVLRLNRLNVTYDMTIDEFADMLPTTRRPSGLPTPIALYSPCPSD